MKVNLKRINNDVLFEAQNEVGSFIRVDGSVSVGGVEGGFRPMELLLAGIGACSAIDVIVFIKKQRQNLKDVTVFVEGERESGKYPAVFKKIHLHYVLEGILEHKKVERALEIGVNKYCSVGQMLKKTAEITYSFEIKK